MSFAPTRRQFLVATAALVAAPAVPGCGSARLTDASPPTRLVSLYPAGDGGTAAWSTFRLPVGGGGGGGAPVRLEWDEETAGSVGAVRSQLRLTVARDVAATAAVAVTLAASGRTLGRVDVGGCRALQPLDLPLSAADTAAALREGVRLTVVGGGAGDGSGLSGIALFAATAENASATAAPAAFVPHLLVGIGGDPATELADRLASLDSLQPADGFAACVLDGQWDLFAATGEQRYRRAIDAHLGQLLATPGGLARDPADPSAGGAPITTFRGAALAAAVVRHRPTHPFVAEATAFWTAHGEPASRPATAAVAVPTDPAAAAEDTYFAAHPMAVVAAARQDRPLLQRAMGRLLAAREILATIATPRRGATTPATRPTTGSADQGIDHGLWVLGLVRALREVRPADRPVELTAALARSADRVAARQRPDGLISTATADPTAAADVRETVALAAGLAIGARAGLLPPVHLATARRVYAGLRASLAADGYVMVGDRPGLGGGGGGAGGSTRPGRIDVGATGWAGQLFAAIHPGAGRS
ncbi:MAG: hypothetical protein JWO31_1494 [Phycisphaerales bacterium]|nr:hypothetical protein [Phycisphaerales bacterium]